MMKYVASIVAGVLFFLFVHVEVEYKKPAPQMRETSREWVLCLA